MRRIIAVALIFTVILVSISPIAYMYGQDKGLFSYEWVRTRTVHAPAVTSEYGPGVMTTINVTVAYPGHGNIYFRASPLTELDMQATAQIAVMVACNMLGLNMNDYDFYISVNAGSIIVGGPSAGGIMTVAVMAALENAEIKPGITMTGMINPDGTIGPVGGLKGKLEAAASSGYKYFLIPLGQRIIVVPNITYREIFPGVIVSSVNYEKIDLVKLGEKLGVKVIEISNVRQAFYYFTGINLTITLHKLPITAAQIIDKYVKNNTLEILNATTYYINSTQKLFSLLPPGTTDVVNTLLKEASRLSEKAVKFLEQDKYYLARAEALSSLQLASQAYFIANGLVSKNSLVGIIRNTNQSLAGLAEKYYGLTSKTAIPVQGLGALMVLGINIHEIQKDIEKAAKSLEKNDLRDTVNYLSDAITRYYSAQLYKAIAENLSGSQPAVDKSMLEKTALSLYGVAKNIYAYAYTLAKDIGANPASLQKSGDFLDKAAEMITRGDYVAGLGYIIDSISLGVTSIHEMFTVNNVEASSVIKDLRINALQNMERLISLGITPYTAINYYLLGEQLAPTNDTGTILFCYIKSSTIAMIQDMLSTTKTAAPTPGPTTTAPQTNTKTPRQPSTTTPGTPGQTLPNITIVPGTKNQSIPYNLILAIIVILVIASFIVGYGVGRATGKQHI